MSDIDLLTDAELASLRAELADATHMQRGLAEFGQWLEGYRQELRAQHAAANGHTKKRAIANRGYVLDQVIDRYGRIDGSE